MSSLETVSQKPNFLSNKIPVADSVDINRTLQSAKNPAVPKAED